LIASSHRFLEMLGQSSKRHLIIAHRGDSFRAPENTIEAALLAFEAGAPAWELDVQLTLDGVPIVLHDESLERTTDVVTRFANDPRAVQGFRVADFTLEEIRTLDAGSWFVSDAGGYRSARHFETLHTLEHERVEHYGSGRVQIPTLAEALTFTRDNNWLVNVEIKSFPDRPEGIVARVLEAIAATGTETIVLISSFEHSDLAELRDRGCQSALGALTSTPLHRTADYLADLIGADTFHTSAEVMGADSVAYRRSPGSQTLCGSLVAELSDRGIPTLVYTVNRFGPDSLATALYQAGVAAIFTDDPHGFRSEHAPVANDSMSIHSPADRAE
jgi:glycerophosphoryl diester phosphodiesterase